MEKSVKEAQMLIEKLAATIINGSTKEATQEVLPIPLNLTLLTC